MKLAYKNVTPEVYAGLKEEMNKIGVSIEGDKGRIATKGIKGSFDRNVAQDTLEIVIDKTPMLMPRSLVANQITNAIERLGGAVV